MPSAGVAGSPRAHEQRQVRNVVAHGGDLAVGEVELGEKPFVGGRLEALALKHVRDPELLRTLRDDRGRAAREDRDFDPRPSGAS